MTSLFDQIPWVSEPDAVLDGRGDLMGSGTVVDPGVDELRSLADVVIACSRAFEAGVLTGEMATEVVRITTEMANAASSMTARAARRVDETRAWKAAGAVSAGHHLAMVTGGSASELNKAVATERRLEVMPKLAQASRSGAVSTRQADEISRTVVLDRSAESDLLEMASGSSFNDLADEAKRRRAAALPDEQARYRHARSQRCLRTWVDAEGVAGLLWKTTPDQLGHFKALHATWVDNRSERARGEGRHESPDHLDADGFWEMIRHTPAAGERGSKGDDRSTAGSGDSNDTGRAHERDVQLHLLVTHDALLRGHTEPGERCEMAGVGPVPVSVVRDILANEDPFVSVLETDGVDVYKVARPGRSMTAAMREALFVRDPGCVVPGCRRTAHLEAHHTEAFADTGHTMLDELANLCERHHDLITHRGYELTGGPGNWWFGPPGGRSPG